MEKEGIYLKNKIKGAGIEINAIANKLEMTQQNLGYHFRKDKVDEDFKKKLFDAYPDVFTNDKNVKYVENEPRSGENMISEDAETYISGGNKIVTNLRHEAEPLYMSSDPTDPFNDGAKFEHLGNGIIRMRIRVVPHKAYAGYLRGFQDPEFYEKFKTVSIDVEKEHKGHYLSFEVKGDSMIPPDLNNTDYMALPGWKAIARELPHHHWQFKLHTHKVKNWIIVHNTEGILIKQIIKHNIDNGEITVHSLNTDYKDQILNLRDVAQLFSVVKYIID